MNCKPEGDLAYIVRTSGQLAGRVVEIVSAAPIGVEFRLPDGVLSIPQDYEWVCRFASPIRVPMTDGFRMSHYACIPDFRLRPIGGVPVEEEQHDETPIKEAA